MNSHDLKEFAQLGQAAYGYLSAAAIRNPRELAGQLQHEDFGKFTLSQAEGFAKRFELVHQFNEEGVLSHGFSASLFRDLGNDGRLIFAIRGTEPTLFDGAGLEGVRDLVHTDLRIGMDGYASPQVIPMYRYFKRLMTPAGAEVQYSASEINALRAVYLDQADGPMELAERVGRWGSLLNTEILRDTGTDAGQGAGVALIRPTASVDVAGHSLGGHLAVLMDRLFPANVRNIVTLNAPGFNALGSNGEGVLRLFSRDWNPGRILRLEGEGDAVSELGSMFPGARMLLGQETGSGPAASIGRNHSAVIGGDGLAVSELLGRYQPAVAADPRVAKTLLHASANVSERSCEGVVGGLSSLLSTSVVTIPTDTSTPASREPLYSAINSLDPSLTNSLALLAGKLRFDASFDVARARTDFVSLVSLSKGTPFQASTESIAAMDALGQVHTALYADWNADILSLLARKDADTLNITDAWLADRGAMLGAVVAKNLRNEPYGTLTYRDGLSALTRYSDLGSGITVSSVDAQAPSFAQVMFGTGGADAGLAGGSRADRLYGGAGNDNISGGEDADRLEGQAGEDTLDGGQGNDLLLGGQGNDTYRFAAGSGRDIVFDYDGLGTLTLNGAPLPALRKLGENVWQSTDKTVSLTLMAQGAGRNDLVLALAGGNDRVVIRHWTAARSLGINLDVPDAATPIYQDTYYGDFRKKTVVDPVDIYDFGPGGYVADGISPDEPDVIFSEGWVGSGERDLAALYGLGGNDALFGTGGAGGDLLDGGDGADLLWASGGFDRILGGSGSDFILAEGTHAGYWMPRRDDKFPLLDPNPDLSLARHVGFDWGVWAPGDWLSGNVVLATAFTSGASGNFVDGGSESDFVMGGTGPDYLLGGTEDDTIQGASAADFVAGGAGDDLIGGDRGDFLLEVPSWLHLMGTPDPSNFAQRLYNAVGAANHGDDVIDAGGGNDWVHADGGGDIVFGGAGEDHLEGDSRIGSTLVTVEGTTVNETDPRYHGSDYLDGGDGADTVFGGGSGDQLVGGAGDDHLLGDAVEIDLPAAWHGADLLEGGSGNDTLWGGGGADLLYGGDGSDQLQGDAPLSQLAEGAHANDTLDGGAGSDTLFGQGGDDWLLGGSGDDVLSGDDQAATGGTSTVSGNDTLDGGSDSDTLLGGKGDDLLIGGAGQDNLDGGEGNDTIVLGPTEIVEVNGVRTYLADTVVSKIGKDKLVMSGATYADLKVEAQLGGLFIYDGGTGAFIEGGLTAKIGTITLDAVATSYARVVNDKLVTPVVAASDGADGVLIGGRANDTLDVRLEDAGVIVAAGLGADVINLHGSGGATVEFARGDGMDSVNAVARAGAAALSAAASGAAAMVSLSVADADTPAQQNVLSLGEGIQPSDLYLVWRSNGTHTLSLGQGDGIAFQLAGYADAAAVPAHAWPFDLIRFADGQTQTLADVVARGVYLMADATAGDDVVTLTPGNDIYAALSGADLVQAGAGGDNIHGDAGDDALHGEAGSDLLFGDDGADTLNGGDGDDTLDGGLGNDTLMGGAGNDQSVDDRLNFSADLVMLGEGDDVYGYGTGEDFATDTSLVSNDTYRIAAGGYYPTGWDQGPARWTISDSGGFEALVIDMQGATWTPADFSFRNAYGTLTLAYRDRLYIEVAGAIDASGAIDTSRMIEALAFDGGPMWTGAALIAKSLEGTAGDDTIHGYATHDTIDGGTGFDIIHGGSGDDVLSGGADSDSIYGGAGHDILRAGSGGALMRGGQGDDRYEIARGDGFVAIVDDGDRSSSQGADVLRIAANRAEVTATLDRYVAESQQDHLVLQLVDGSATVRIELDSASLSDHAVDVIEFDDQTATLAELMTGLAPLTPTAGDDWLEGTSLDEVMAAGDGNDFLRARDGDDSLTGGNGDDVIYPGRGANMVTGGQGNDWIDVSLGDNTVLYGPSDGTDRVGMSFEPNGSNRLVLASAWLPQHVQLRWDGTSRIVLSTPTAGDSVTFDAVDNGNKLAFSRIEFAVGMAWDMSAIVAIANEPTAGNDSIVDYFGEGRLLSGGGGDDALYSRFSNAHLAGGDGNDWLAAHAGPTLWLDGGAGNDQTSLVFYAGLGSLEAHRNPDGSYTLATAQGDPQGSLIGIESLVVNSNQFLSLTTGDVAMSDATPSVGQTLGLVNGLVNEAGLTVQTVQWQRLDGSAWVDISEAIQPTFVVGQNLVGRQIRVHVTFMDPQGSGQVAVSQASAAVEELNLIVGTAGNDPLLGTASGDRMEGLAGNDSLDGRGGDDLLLGGPGDDTYIVGPEADTVMELAGEGLDTVTTSLTYTLPEYVETLVISGSAAVSGTGNALANTMVGNAANNALAGLEGDDLIDGGAGADSLVGGAGADTLVVDNLGDVVTELASSPDLDTVRSTVTWQLSAGVERLILEGAAAINGSVNRATNTGPVSLIGNSAANTLTGGDSNDMLDGGAGVDTLVGGYGDDTYVSDSASETITELAGTGLSWGGYDTVMSSVTRTLGSNLEALVLTGMGAINGTGNALDNAISGNDAANVLNGGAGTDALAGGKGNDTYVVDLATDQVQERAGEGTDTVQASLAWTLGPNVENLTLTGSAAIAGTGNELDNALTGNGAANTLTGGSGNDTLDGGLGNDTLAGGAGDDTYLCNVATDVVSEVASSGIDTIRSAVTWTLGATSNVENLVLTGTTAINGTGNGFDNALTGNAAANTLTGGAGHDMLDGAAGADKLIGGTGNDVFVVDQSTDTITENANEGSDTVRAALTWTLGSNLENLVLTGMAAINGTGNTVANVLTGNAAANTLTGGAGADTLDGGVGTDLLVGGAAGDSYAFGRGHGVDTVQENDASAGVVDRVLFGSGIASTDISFVRATNNLEARINGSADKLVLKDWYLGAAYQIEQFQFADGSTLSAAQAQGRATIASLLAPVARESVRPVRNARERAARPGTGDPGMPHTGSPWGDMAMRALSLIDAMAAFNDASNGATDVRTERTQPYSASSLAPPVM